MEMKSLTINGKKYDKFTPGDATDPVTPFKVREMIVAPADEEGVSVYSEFISGSDQNTPILNFYGTTGDEATILRNIADPTKNWDAANKQYVDNKVSDKSLGLSGATVGQIIKIKTVDSSGHPTAWEPADMPSGGSGSGSSTSGGGLRKMSTVSSYLGIPTEELPTSGTIWMSISHGENMEFYSGTITIEDGDMTANNLVTISNGSVSQLNQATMVGGGFVIYGMSAFEYVGVWQLVGSGGADINKDEIVSAVLAALPTWTGGDY